MKVTIKGQITIPQALRERYGLAPGTEVEFLAGPEALQLKARRRSSSAGSRYDAWLANAAGSATTALTTDEIMATTRGED